jgi:dimethylargininase
LKSVSSYLGDGALLITFSKLDPDNFQVREVIKCESTENAANCLRVNKFLLIPSGAPVTETRLKEFAAEHNLKTVTLDISEFEKGDGSLSCLSVIL